MVHVVDERGEGREVLRLPFPGAAVAARGDALDAFHPAVATWFRRRFPDGATEPQEQGWPHVAAGRNTLVAAPTGSGKTLAGFLVAIDGLYRAHERGDDVGATARVVYVSPLKALAVDIAHNLQRPLDEIAGVAQELGLTPAPIRVGVRTGDTTPAERASMVRRPPDFVVTTPESLYLLVTSESGRKALKTVETVIVDEIHAVARDKRGAHLALTLERLEALCERPLTRVGLSATQRPIETVGRLLVGDRPLPQVVDVGHQRNLDLGLELPDGELEAIASAEQMNDVLDRVAELVAEHRTTLVFVNTRRLAERLAHQLGERLGDDVVAAHHGSLSKERRLRVETRLRAGDLRALVATASLELGIDIGPVELVCQIGSPRSIATFLQRVGRSNHSRAGTPKGRIYPLTRDELVECTALLAAVRAGRLDSIVPARLPLDIAAQQVVAEVAAQEWTTDGLYDLVRRAAHYTDLDRAAFDEVVELVSEGIETGRGRRGTYVHHDGVNGELRGRRGARLAAATSGGAIPETGDYRVVAEPDDMFVGTVNEDWAIESMAGDIFLLGTHSWQIRKVEPGVVRVRDAGDTPPTVPFWLGEAPARTAELSEEVSALRHRVDGFLTAGEPDAARTWLMAVTGVPPDAATMIVDYLAVGRAALGAMPTSDCLVLERFFDDTGGMQLVVHSPYGGRVNRALALALRKKFCRSFNFELQAAAGDDAIVLSLGLTHSFPLDEVPRYVTSRTLRDTLEHAVLDSPMFQARWRWNLNRALMVLRFRGGKKNPPPIQRMESDDLLAAVFPQAAACQDNITGPIEIPDHLLVRQTLDDTLHEALDIDGVMTLVERIEAGEVRVHCVDTTEASVLSHEIITAKPYAFLDDEETQNRRTNAVMLRRGLQVDLAAIGALDPAAVEQVHAEVEPLLETPDDLHDLLSSLVLTRPRAGSTELFAELVARNRAVEFTHDGVELWATAEARDEAGRALAGADDDAVVRAVRGHLEISGITTVARLGDATLLPASTIEWALAALQQSGVAMQGRYTAGAADVGGVEWVARRLLSRMHSYSRRTRRSRVEAATAQDYMRFLLRWQHVAPGTQVSGAPGLAAVVEQLQGHEAAAGAWEAEILARRLRHYDPAWLDRLCHDGEVAWLRLTPRAAPAAAPIGTTPADGDADADGAGGGGAGGGGAGGGDLATPGRSDSVAFVRAAKGTIRRSGPNGAGRAGTGGPPQPTVGATPAAPSKATPISVVTRADLGWLLAAARGGIPAPAVPEVGATAELVEAMASRGASFATDLMAATRRLPTDVERGLWDGVARGLVMCDGFGAIRARVGGTRGAVPGGAGSAASAQMRRDRGVGDPALGRLAAYARPNGRSGNSGNARAIGRLHASASIRPQSASARSREEAVGTGGAHDRGERRDAARLPFDQPAGGQAPGERRAPAGYGQGHGRRLARLANAARATGGSAGRWSLVPAPDDGIDRDDLAEAVAGQLLARWGVVVRDLAVHDSLRVPWREVQWALRRLEDRGLVRGGRFVAGFSGEQYALPEAAEQLAAVRKQPRTGERVVVNATDPLNLVGVVVPGARVPAVRTNRVTYVDGVAEEAPSA